MIDLFDWSEKLVLQFPGLTPHYTQHPIFPDMVTSAIVAAMIAIGLNIGMALLRRKTTNMEKMKTVMKETGEWRKKYTEAIKKRDKQLIEELKKKQSQMQKMSMEMQQQQMRPMMLYMVPSFMLWIFVFPAIFGQTVALSPITVPYLTCSADNVKMDTPVQTTNSTNAELKQGPCKVPGQVFLWGWFLLVNFAFTGIIAKVTNTSIPTF
ncbi:MAG: EMC3/TMCO1 family protein [Candidatus Nitrosocosmicus sp.]|nr:EMC3/TMCO1 family protein [Candidatus Nitrosocosmicus sp.]MDN5866724.1 EMC3/TMCO1 family protein [Candidatus Nitrosocosmicus sp.]